MLSDGVDDDLSIPKSDVVSVEISREPALQRAREKQSMMEERRRRLKSAETRKKMRAQFLRKQKQREVMKRRQELDQKNGRDGGKMFGRASKGNRHKGGFHDRQQAMLKLHLEAKEHSAKNREKQIKWVEDSLKMFKPWMKPLKYVFTN